MTTLELDDMELIEAARGQRWLRDLAQADADRQGGPSTRAIFERSVKYHEELAEKFDRARKAGASRK